MILMGGSLGTKVNEMETNKCSQRHKGSPWILWKLQFYQWREMVTSDRVWGFKNMGIKGKKGYETAE